MPYLAKSDITADVYAEIAEAIGRGDTTNALLPHVQRAQAIVRGRLSPRYDMATEFARSAPAAGTTDADARNPLLVYILVNLVIFFFFKTQEVMPAIRRANYEDAIKELDLLQSGDSVLVGVPPAPAPDPDDPAPVGDVAYSTNPKRSRFW